MNARVYEYFRRLVIAFNQLLCVALLGGWPDETISSCVYRREKNGSKLAGYARMGIDWLALELFDQTEHCAKAAKEERTRIQQPPEFR